MKVIAFNGSSRKGGNTDILINYVLDELKKEGIETEVSFSGTDTVEIVAPGKKGS